jgi:hypothetical protein
MVPLSSVRITIVSDRAPRQCCRTTNVARTVRSLTQRLDDATNTESFSIASDATVPSKTASNALANSVTAAELVSGGAGMQLQAADSAFGARMKHIDAKRVRRSNGIERYQARFGGLTDSVQLQADHIAAAAWTGGAIPPVQYISAARRGGYPIRLPAATPDIPNEP